MMSTTIDYCFNYPKDLAGTAEDINECLGCSLAPYEGDTEDLFDQFMSMEFSLRTMRDFENERELDFQNFRYKLDFRTAMGAASARPLQLPTMSAVVYSLHRRLGITGILVYDLGILLARYEERELPNWGKALFDTVSGTPFIGFGSHLKQLETRMPVSWRRYVDEWGQD